MKEEEGFKIVYKVGGQESGGSTTKKEETQKR
jgi:hypothetical protein